MVRNPWRWRGMVKLAGQRPFRRLGGALPSPILALILAHCLGPTLLFAPTRLDARAYALTPADLSLVGDLQYVESRYEDTLPDLARVHDLGYSEIRGANPAVDPWLPGAGTRVLIPGLFILPDAPRDGIVVNLAEMRLYYYPPPKAGAPAMVITYPVGIGREDWPTPTGAGRVTQKVANPAWYPPASVRREHAAQGRYLPKVVPPGPNNPLGAHALRLNFPGYLLHGTNRRYGIGMRVSHGCIRLYPNDIESLFEMVPLGTPVHLIHQAYKAGVHNGRLYVEVHPPGKGGEHGDIATLLRVVNHALAEGAGQLTEQPNLEPLAEILANANGVPVALEGMSAEPGKGKSAPPDWGAALEPDRATESKAEPPRHGGGPGLLRQ